jgi:hypothetical protein
MNNAVRPDTLPAVTRPGGVRPGGGGLPGTLPSRPGGVDRPGVDRPGDFNRPGLGDRPINIGDIHVGNNTVINNRPSWANIDRTTVAGINNRWRGQIGGLHNWPATHPARAAYWRGWGDGVRTHWPYYRRPGSWFGPNWWIGHPHPWCGWHYGYGFNARPWRYWWTVPTYAACVSWFRWSAPAGVWSEPVYYDYGSGGNVTYDNDNVYINGEQVATADEFAQSAADLATVAPPASEEEEEMSEWMALGTFALTTGEQDVDPTRVVQLAVNKDGVISGTLYNIQTDNTQTVQGQVDKETQRVAFRVGESQSSVIETGLYNLTQNEVPLLVHYGTEKVENWMLVRMEEPAEESGEGQPASSPME